MSLEFEYENNEEQHINPEDFLTNEREAKKKAREEKRLRKRYKFSDKEHSRPGIVSSLLALNSILFLIAAIIISTISRGNGGILVGILGAISFIGSLVGIILGLLSFKNTDVLLKYAWIGLISNGIIWLLMGVLLVFGL